MTTQSSLVEVETAKPDIITQLTLRLTSINTPLQRPHGQLMLGPLAWAKGEVSEGGYILSLSEEQIQECNNAMRTFLG